MLFMLVLVKLAPKRNDKTSFCILKMMCVKTSTNTRTLHCYIQVKVNVR